MYTVGQMSRICNTSVKTLHYYDKIGFLKPAYIDKATNYRYYDYYHIRQLKIINMLKDYEIPLKDIQKIIEEDDLLMGKEILKQKIKDIKKNIARQQKLIDDISTHIKYMDDESKMLSSSEVSDVVEEVREKILICGVREKTSLRKIDILVKKLFQRLYAYKLNAVGNLMTIYYDNEINPNDCDIEVCIPVNNDLGIGTTRYLESVKCLCTIVKGPYSELSYGYEKIINWINRYDYQAQGHPFEIYLDGLIAPNPIYPNIRADIGKNPSEFMTKVCIPIK